MSIRYFATNRDCENLGREFSRGERLGLQKGGYHFVDMEAYMSYYLSEVDAKTMPKSVIVNKSQETVFKEFLENEKIGRVVICVHGFCVNFHDAQSWYSILTDTLKHSKSLKDKVVTDPKNQNDIALLNSNNVKKRELTAFIGFSWPSNGNVLSYLSDQGEARSSANVLANLIARIRGMLNNPSVNLICHSMGNFLACHMFKQLVKEESIPYEPDATKLEALKKRISRDTAEPEGKYFVDRYIMLAPDVERRHVTKCVKILDNIGENNEEAQYVGQFYSGLEHLVGQVHNFYSRFDGALAISNFEKAPRKAIVSAKGMLDKLTFGMIDFLERNPDEKWEQRLGSSQHPIIATRNMKSHNAVELSGREIGHSDYVDSKEIAEEIASILVSPLE
ncbi:MAG: alpha/beta hydrolase [Candidatus Scalindua sp.]|jgi:esterase/lipase superfamily enzyme|nr:alpha/beta hydrolase [Candidatus Scalindua sp.]